MNIGEILVEQKAKRHPDLEIAGKEFKTLLTQIVSALRINPSVIHLFYARTMANNDCIAFKKDRGIYFNLLPFIEQHWDEIRKSVKQQKRPINYWFYQVVRCCNGKSYSAAGYKVLVSLHDTLLGDDYDADGNAIRF